MKSKIKSKNQKEHSDFFLKAFVLFSCFLIASFSTIYAQTKTVTGTVTDDFDVPLIGVTVSVVNTTTGTITDVNGKYSIQAAPGQELEFSYVGMATQKIAVGAQDVINVKMTETLTLLDETVVIGYGSAKKIDLTGSIVRIDATQIANRPATNPLASLQGKVSGVQIINAGSPGQDPEIRMRGTNSINGYKPLYVVDGFFTDNINYLNPADIESMDVLKDPSSLAIFGNRGANGVIIITTKKAKKGQTIVSINSALGFRHISDRIKLTNAAQFKELYDEQGRNQGDAPFDYTPWNADTDWQDEIIQTGFITNNNISITGSSDKNRFYMGVGYTKEEGSLKYEEYSRITVNLSSDYEVNNFMRFGFQFNGSRTLPADLKSVSGAVRAAPIAPISSMDYVNPTTGQHEFLYHAMPAFQAAQVSNPMLAVEGQKRHNLGTNYRGSGNIYGEIDFLKNFKFRATFSMDYQTNEARNYSPMVFVYNPTLPESQRKERISRSETVSQSKNTIFNTQADYILTYENKFGDHGLTATAGITTNYTDVSNLSAARSQDIEDLFFSIPNDNKDKWWISSIGDKNMTNSGSQYRRFTMSYLIRGLYNYQNKYLLNASYRRDGSSVFRGVDNTWDNFYSFGGGWVVSEEKFMQNQDFLDFLKLKGSYGVLGSQNTGGGGNYPTYPNLSITSSAVFDGREIPTWGLSYLLPTDRTLGWEKTHSWEIGIETAWLNQRLRFEPTYYNKETKDIIVLAPPISGAQNALGNAGNIQNRGFEFTLSWNDRINDFTYGVSANLTTLKNEVKKLAYGDKWEMFDDVCRTTPGHSIAHFYGYEVIGVYQNEEDIYQSPTNTLATASPGDLKFRDIDGDGKITQADRTQIGKPTPDAYYGFSVNMGYKGFDLSVDMMGVYGNEIYRSWDRHTYAQLNFLSDRMNRWNGEGTSNWEPILHRGRALNTMASSYYVEDASFFRIKNVQLGYTFSPSLLKKIYLKSLRIYANVDNLKTWKKNTGYVPEIGGSALKSGIDAGTYPMAAIYTFGINLTF